MKKILTTIISLMFLFPLMLNAVSSDSVDYEIADYIVDASIDVSGNLTVKEVIGVKGTFNGYIRDLVYKNSNLNTFTGKDEDFSGSSIYNAGSIEILKVGTVSYKGDLDFDVFSKEVKESRICSSKEGCYTRSSIIDGTSLKMYNETIDDITYFYIEYLLSNVVVMHEDTAELYYNFIGDSFDDDINRYQLRVSLPMESEELVRVWAHGPLNGNVASLNKTENNNKIYYGGYLEIEEIPANTPVDMRMAFSKNLIMVDHPYLKKSNVVALEKILAVEEERADEANRVRKSAKTKVSIVYTFTGIYLLGILVLTVFVYKKYDKERKASFEGEYYREFIDDYDVVVIEYLFEKHITEKAFSTSILNMIYKKNIKFEQIDKKDYKFIKVSEDNLSDCEKLVMNIIFDDAGDGKTTSLSQIKKYAKKLVNDKSPFLNKFTTWKNMVTKESVKENFYENLTTVKSMVGLYTIMGFILISFHFSLGIINILTLVVFIATIVFLIYIVAFTKKTERGIEHYTKWKAFKKFLLDFGRFDEKELPEITLWERYLVYASIFGIADKVGETMKVKFNELGYGADGNRDIIFDYMLWSNLNRNISTTVHSSINTAQMSVAQAASTNYSSGGGFGGGFSGGGGFGGGGGGGRGF